LREPARACVSFAVLFELLYTRVQEIRMRKPVVITTPIPSVEETARMYGVSPARTKELIELADRVASRHLRPPQRQITRKGATRHVRSRGRGA
jgi:hypothetical protein